MENLSRFLSSKLNHALAINHRAPPWEADVGVLTGRR